MEGEIRGGGEEGRQHFNAELWNELWRGWRSESRQSCSEAFPRGWEGAGAQIVKHRLAPAPPGGVGVHGELGVTQVATLNHSALKSLTWYFCALGDPLNRHGSQSSYQVKTLIYMSYNFRNIYFELHCSLIHSITWEGIGGEFVGRLRREAKGRGLRDVFHNLCMWKFYLMNEVYMNPLLQYFIWTFSNKQKSRKQFTVSPPSRCYH